MKRFVLFLFFCFSFSYLYPQNATVLQNEGNKALGAKQYALALLKYEKALAVWGNKPADNAMIFAMGTCAYSVNDMKKSLTYIDRSIAAGYNLDMAYQYRACIMKAQNNADGYLATIKEGLAKVPASKSLKQSMAKYYFEEGDKHYHAGMEIVKKVVEQVKGGKFSTSDKAFKDQNDKAKTEFRECIKWMNLNLELTPDDANAKTIKGNCLSQMNMLI